MAKRRIKRSIVRKFKLAVTTFFFMLSCILYNKIYLMNIVPIKYLKLLLLCLLVINLFGLLMFEIKSKISKIIGFITYIFLLLICSLGIRYSTLTLNFFNKAFETKKEFVLYDVIVLNDSSIKNSNDLNNKVVGCLEIDTNEYKSKLDSIVSVEYESGDLFTIYESFMNKDLEAIVINHSYINMLEEQYKDFKDSYRVVLTFNLEFEVEQNNEKLKELRPITIYITGLDSRSGLIESTGLSDVNMLVTINPNTNDILLTGIPRDAYVQLHGTTGLKDKLTHAGTYGVKMSEETIEDFLGIEIDYTIKVGFNSVINLVDFLGGIDIDSDKGFWSYHIKGWKVEEGINHMNGKQALAYARERYAYAEGDQHRVKNQLQVFTAVFNKLINSKEILYKYDVFLDEFSDLYSTNIPKDYVTLLMKKQITTMKSWKITNQSVGGTYIWEECYSIPGTELVVMELDMNSVEKVRNKINEVLNK